MGVKKQSPHRNSSSKRLCPPPAFYQPGKVPMRASSQGSLGLLARGGSWKEGCCPIHCHAKGRQQEILVRLKKGQKPGDQYARSPCRQSPESPSLLPTLPPYPVRHGRGDKGHPEKRTQEECIQLYPLRRARPDNCDGHCGKSELKEQKRSGGYAMSDLKGTLFSPMQSEFPSNPKISPPNARE